MSNELKDYLNELDMYNKAVFKDFLSQNGDALSWPEDFTMKKFVEYLLSRMYHEGLPEKEPIDSRERYSKVN